MIDFSESDLCLDSPEQPLSNLLGSLKKYLESINCPGTVLCNLYTLSLLWKALTDNHWFRIPIYLHKLLKRRLPHLHFNLRPKIQTFEMNVPLSQIVSVFKYSVNKEVTPVYFSKSQIYTLWIHSYLVNRAKWYLIPLCYSSI